METISSVYVRTAQGRYTAFNPSTKLPKPLKTLLLAVDGKILSQVLVAQMANLGDVTTLLSQLESSGLIEDKYASNRHSGYPTSGYPVSGYPASGYPTSGFAGTPHNPAAAAHVPSPVATSAPAAAQQPMYLVSDAPAASTPPQGARNALRPKTTNWTATAPAELDEMPSMSLESLAASQTQFIADTMATFVLTHLPGQACVILKELESMRTPAQLKATLPGYAQLVESVGLAGRHHLVQLKQLIDQKFQAFE